MYRTHSWSLAGFVKRHATYSHAAYSSHDDPWCAPHFAQVACHDVWEPYPSAWFCDARVALLLLQMLTKALK